MLDNSKANLNKAKGFRKPFPSSGGVPEGRGGLLLTK